MFDAIHDFVAWAPLGLPAFLLYITVVVFFHELGHFLMARSFGAKVDVFSVGFGPEIFGFNDKRGTRWRVSWLPIGGYVKFAGDMDAASTPDRAAAAQMSAEERAGLMALRPLHQRALVAVAGPMANFLLAIIVFTGVFLYAGNQIIPPVVGTVLPGSPAATAGLLAGDRVTRIDGTAITDFNQLPEIIGISGGQSLTVGLLRAGQSLEVRIVPRLVKRRDPLGDVAEMGQIGVGPQQPLQVVTEYYSPVGAFSAACSRTAEIVRLTFRAVGQIIVGHASVKELHGPLGIARITRKVASFGLLPFLNLIAVLSVSIGLVNLFPIPLLDGGHLLYYACEAVLGRPLGERAQDVGFRLGLVLVLGLMLLVTWNDLARLNLF